MTGSDLQRQIAEAVNEVSATQMEMAGWLNIFQSACFTGRGTADAGERYLLAAQKHLDAVASHIELIRTKPQ